MAAPASHPAFPRDAWPTFELKRVPNGEMGVLMEFPATPQMAQLGVDVLGFLMEPRRVEMMHANAADILEALGLVRTPLKSRPLTTVPLAEVQKLFPPERYSNNPLDLVALSDARGEVERLRKERDEQRKERDEVLEALDESLTAIDAVESEPGRSGNPIFAVDWVRGLKLMRSRWRGGR